MRLLPIVLLATILGLLSGLTACTTSTPPPASPTPTWTPSATASPTSTASATPTPTPTQTPSPWPSLTPSPSPSPTHAPYAACPDAPPARLSPGQVVMVNIETTASSRVRLEPGTQARIVGVMQPGQIVQIIGGPQCANRLVWWRIQTGELSGWAAEGDAETIWLTPLRSTRLALTWSESLSLHSGYFDLLSNQWVSDQQIGPLYQPLTGSAYTFAINLTSTGLLGWAYGSQSLNGGRLTQTNQALLLLDTLNQQVTDLPTLPGQAPQIFWAPDGQKVALVWRNLESAASTLQILRPNGQALSEPRPYARTARDGIDPLWSPDSSSLLYSSNENGCRLVSLAFDGADSICLSPDSVQAAAWSPDSQRVLSLAGEQECSWTPGPDGPQTVCKAPATPPACRLNVVNLDGATETCLSTGPAYAPAWSPGGEYIAFIAGSGETHTLNISAVSKDAAATPLGPAKPNRLYWSPNGQTLAYDCGGLCLVEPNGANQRAYLAREAAGWQLVNLAWSPDARRIAAIFNTPAGSVPLYLIHAEKSQLINPNAGLTSPLHWSSDGYFLAFTNNTLTPQIINAAGTNLASLPLSYQPLWLGWK